MDLLTPDWPVPANVRAVCTTRTGGVSQGPYDSLNLGDHVGDEPQRVARNRAIVAEAMGARPVYMEQVHGVGVARLDADARDGLRADGCFTSHQQVACTIMVADCLPVLLAAEDGSIVGAAHAGWRGACEGVVEATVKAMGVAPASLVAWLGPCIGPEAFEVGDEVRAAFAARDPQDAQHFQPYREGKWLADLPALTRRRLHAMGVSRIHGNDGTRAWCTVANPSRFFSHRRDRVSGRFAAVVWLA
ncbi:peptidoglycan editing factor PgeF [Ramlibacter sp. PS4R-6]|uniref:peptidoglycan editing factor PgeF n=1 Tax=Ramlibacter sp. PS4R-6 TaxID=3133438 RepID=UPI0030B6CA4B